MVMKKTRGCKEAGALQATARVPNIGLISVSNCYMSLIIRDT